MSMSRRKFIELSIAFAIAPALPVPKPRSYTHTYYFSGLRPYMNLPCTTLAELRKTNSTALPWAEWVTKIVGGNEHTKFDVIDKKYREMRRLSERFIINGDFDE